MKSLLAAIIFTQSTRDSRVYRYSATGTHFEPIWQPAFITELVPEDRCQLNGLALRDGEPGYVTALAESDSVGGWRAVADDIIGSNEVLNITCRNLQGMRLPLIHGHRIEVIRYAEPVNQRNVKH